jgi:transposase
MGKIKKLELSVAEKEALEKGYRNGEKHPFRERCQMILLKSEGLTNKAIGEIFSCHELTVWGWVKRYQTEGIDGLKTKPGSGRPPILLTEEDLERVREKVSEHRQRIGLAKEELEKELGKTFSEKTLRRFLKKTVADINEYERDRKTDLTNIFID